MRVTSQPLNPARAIYTTRTDYQYAVEQAVHTYLLGDLPIHVVAECYRVDVGDLHLVIEGHLAPCHIPDRDDWGDAPCVPITADIQAAMGRFARQFVDGDYRMQTGLRVSGAVIGAWLGRRCGGHLTSEQYRLLATLVEIMGYRPIALCRESIRAIPLYAASDVIQCIPRITDATPIGYVGVASPIPDLVAIQYASNAPYSAIPDRCVLICSYEETPRFVAHVAGAGQLVSGVRADGVVMIQDCGQKSPIDWIMGIHEIRDIRPDRQCDISDIPF